MARSAVTGAVPVQPVTPVLAAKQSERNPPSAPAEVASVTVERGHAHEESTELMLAVADRPNVLRAYDRVWRDQGATHWHPIPLPRGSKPSTVILCI